MTAPRLLFCLGTAKGLAALEPIARRGDGRAHLVCTFRETHTEGNSDEAIIALARESGLTAYLWEDLRTELPELVSRGQIAGIVAVGWRYLIPMDVVESLPLGLMVFHDSLLPRHRGFAPLATAILCGDREAGVTVLHGCERMDAGEIIAQRRMELKESDSIATAIARALPIYGGLMEELLELLDTGAPLPRIQQDESAATYSIWRNPEDAEIDWNQDAPSIDRLVRASGSPYPGAFTGLHGRMVRVRRVELLPDIEFSIREPGKVWQLLDGIPSVVCGRGILRIVDASWGDDETPHLPLRSLRVRYGRRR